MTLIIILSRLSNKNHGIINHPGFSDRKDRTPGTGEKD